MSPLNLAKATATEYYLVFPKVPNDPNIHASDELKLNIFNINIPTFSLEDTKFLWQGKYVEFHIGGVSFDPLTVSFVVDSEYRNWKLLFRWLTYIANNKDKPSNVPNDYVTDASIILYDNFHKKHTFITFKNIWIQNLGELQLSIREGETYIECNATFQYDRYEIEDA